MPAAVLNVEPETPESAQGDTEESPKPAPRAKSASETAHVTTAPAAMLAQDTPDSMSVHVEPSVRTEVSKVLSSRRFHYAEVKFPRSKSSIPTAGLVNDPTNAFVWVPVRQAGGSVCHSPPEAMSLGARVWTPLF